MILVIGIMDFKMQNFIKNFKFKKRMMFLNKMCNVKLINEECDVIIPFEIILNSGLVSNTLVHFEELLISVKVNKVFYGNPYNKKVLETLKNKYHFELIELSK